MRRRFTLEIQDIIHKISQRGPDVNSKEYAVLLPIFSKNGELHVLFEIRSAKLNRQPNEICFPGGKREVTDSSIEYTAVRETCEELGIEASQITNIYPLEGVHLGVKLHAFVGFITTNKFQWNEDEVASVFSVPLEIVLNTEPTVHTIDYIPTPSPDFPFHLIPGGKDYPFHKNVFHEYFYQFDDKVVWGWTAHILHQLVEILTEKRGFNDSK